MLPLAGQLSTSSLADVRQAIGLEWRHGRQPTPVRVVAANRVSPDEHLWHLTVHTNEPLPDGHAWSEARIYRELTDGPDAPPWDANVVEVESASSSLFVWAPNGTAPELGDAHVAPFDFLRAPKMLVSEGRLSSLHPELERRLAAASGVLTGVPLNPAKGAGPWNSSWGYVWGPPGTGKTYTLGRGAAELLADPTERVLVVSTTNRATDAAAFELGDALLERGRDLLHVRRVGRPVRLDGYRGGLASLLPGNNPALHARIAEVRAAIETSGNRVGRVRLRRELADLLRGLPSLKQHVQDPLIHGIVTTLHAALSLVVSDEVVADLEQGRPPFTTVVVDEAGLVGRAQVAAVSLLASRRMVLVGDPRQLSPIAKATRSMPRTVMEWVARSGLHHLDAERVDDHVHLLTSQRRMHPDICRGVSAFMYQGRLRDDPSVTGRAWRGAGTLRNLPRMVWYVLDEDPSVTEIEAASAVGVGGSRRRVGTMKVLEALFEAHPELEKQTGLFVTPYRAQAAVVSTWLAERGLDRWQSSTVHAQQGAQAQVVLFDTVHASSTGWPSAEWRGLVNVGLSRAQQLCVLIATTQEVSQPWLRSLRPHLAARYLHRTEAGLSWREVETELRQENMFAAQLQVEPDEVDGPELEPMHAESAALGAQLERRRRLRPLLSSEQRALVERDLSDAGPRLVRGVAGSGKTLVLAHWAARALDGLGIASVVVVYANAALRPLLEQMLVDAWERTRDVDFPWDRVHLMHVRELLHGLLKEKGLPDPTTNKQRYDYEGQARAVLEAGTLLPRFDCVLVDEAQDLGHDTLRVVTQLTKPLQGSLPVMVFYDNAQNVYGRRAPVWKEFGLDMRGRSDVMRESFRSTRPITELALNIVHRLRPLQNDADLRELTKPSASPRGPLLVETTRQTQPWWRAEYCTVDGEMPTVRLLSSEDEERAAVAAQLQIWLQDERVRRGDIRILAPKKRVGEALVEHLVRALPGVRVRFASARGFCNDPDAVVVTTPQSFKGYDAEVVMVVAVDQFVAGWELLVAPLYVAMTRARTVLWLSAVRTGEGRIVGVLEGLPSELIHGR